MTNLIIASDVRLADYAKAVKDGLELSSGARSTSTYYHSKNEQISAVRNKVTELYNVDKSIPLLLACMDDSTFFFRQEVLRKELSSGFANGPQGIVAPSVWMDDRLQEAMINHVIGSLPITYALRLFASFKDDSINNSRTRSKIVAWVLANLSDFTVVKYRNKMKAVLQHAFGKRAYSSIIRNLELYMTDRPHDADMLNRDVFKFTQMPNKLTAKLLLFVARKGKVEWYSRSKYITAYYKTCKARTERTFLEHAKLLDFHTVTGIIASYPNNLFAQFIENGVLRDDIKAKLLEGSKVMSDDQKVRTKKLQQKTGATVRTDVDYSKVQTESLYKTEGVETERKVRAKRDRIDLPYAKIGIIQDVSLSNRGGKDSKNTPAAIIGALHDTLHESAKAYTELTSTSQTDLAGAFVKLIDQHNDLDAIFVLSDGYENYPYEGCLNDLVERYKRTRNIQVIHCSPYVSAEMKAKSRDLGPNIISMAVNKPSQISTQMKARMLDFNPRAYFESQFSNFLDKDTKLIAVEEEIIL